MGIENIDALKDTGTPKTEEDQTVDFADNDPHPVDENPEDHCGDEVPDPWAPSQEVSD